MISKGGGGRKSEMSGPMPRSFVVSGSGWGWGVSKAPELQESLAGEAAVPVSSRHGEPDLATRWQQQPSDQPEACLEVWQQAGLWGAAGGQIGVLTQEGPLPRAQACDLAPAL